MLSSFLLLLGQRQENKMEGDQLAKVTTPTVDEIEEDPQITIQKLNNKIENFKLKMQDFSEFVKTMESNKMDRVRKNSETIKVMADMVLEEMTKMYEQLLVDVLKGTASEIDVKTSEKMCETVERTAFDIIHKMKFLYNEGNILLN
ncbi:uncharacterized protein [Diabrotica undecimpunctata]|uniref:uncharacterized protein n=1 Tax=Diabrotica undecimpunctata TaxID=50387 RepID=UPI003B638782